MAAQGQEQNVTLGQGGQQQLQQLAQQNQNAQSAGFSAGANNPGNAQPGGNFTGSSFLSLELAGKRVELLKDIFPNLRTLAILANTDHPGEQSEWQTTQRATEALGADPAYIPFFGARELDEACNGLHLINDR